MIEKSMIDIIADIKVEENSKAEEEKIYYHKNCGETLIEALKIKYELDIDENIYKMLAPYGFGLQTGNTCGAFAGGIAAIGLMFTEDKPSINDKMKEIVKSWVETYIEKFGSINCSDVRPNHMDPKRGCLKVMEEAGTLFEEFIIKYL